MATALIETQESLNRFLYEAKMCVEQRFGFAAMLTAFSVMLGVSEALLGSRKRVQIEIETFVDLMNDHDSWIRRPQSGAFSDRDIASILADVRDGLAHQYSLPADVMLIVTMQEVAAQDPDKCLIAVAEFVDAVERTVNRIISDTPDVPHDPQPPTSIIRGAADRLSFPEGTPYHEASGVPTH